MESNTRYFLRRAVINSSLMIASAYLGLYIYNSTKGPDSFLENLVSSGTIKQTASDLRKSLFYPISIPSLLTASATVSARDLSRRKRQKNSLEDEKS